MMTDSGLRRLTDADVAAFYGAPFGTLTITQQALSDDFWERRTAAGQDGCKGSSCSCRQARITPTVRAALIRAHTASLL